MSREKRQAENGGAQECGEGGGIYFSTAAESLCRPKFVDITVIFEQQSIYLLGMDGVKVTISRIAKEEAIGGKES